MQHPGDGARPPAREPGGGQMRRLGQAQRDLPHAEAFVDMPAEDLPHDLRLGLGDLDVGRDPVTAWNPPVAVGDLPPNHLALSRAKEFAPAVPFRHLHALVFGDRSLNLRKQACLRIIGQGLVEKDHADAEALEFVQNQDLIGVLARGDPDTRPAPPRKPRPRRRRAAGWHRGAPLPRIRVPPPA